MGKDVLHNIRVESWWVHFFLAQGGQEENMSVSWHEVEMPAFRGRCFLFRKRNVYIFVWVTWAKWTVSPVVVKIGLDSKCYPPCNRSCAPRQYQGLILGGSVVVFPARALGWMVLPDLTPKTGRRGGVILSPICSATHSELGASLKMLMFYEQTIPEGILERVKTFFGPLSFW